MFQDNHSYCKCNPILSFLSALHQSAVLWGERPWHLSVGCSYHIMPRDKLPTPTNVGDPHLCTASMRSKLPRNYYQRQSALYWLKLILNLIPFGIDNDHHCQNVAPCSNITNHGAHRNRSGQPSEDKEFNWNHRFKALQYSDAYRNIARFSASSEISLSALRAQ